MSKLQGFATESATKAYADRTWQENPKISPNTWRIFEGKTVAKVGFGTYRMNGADGQEAALKKALHSGINIIDTAPNYMDGDAEELIGKVLTAEVAAGKLSREEIVIVTKTGYIQGRDFFAVQSMDDELPDVVSVTNNFWHCIHPTYIAKQIKQSRERLNVECIDCVLLHNPEYYLGFEAANAEGDLSPEIIEEFYRRIEDAFTYLEGLVKEGTIGCYGLSANTFVVPKDQADFVDLARVFKASQDAAQEAWGRKKRPNFRVIEMPINLMELGAVHTKNTTALTFDGSEEVTTLELASRMKLAVLANRPLNAFPVEGGTFRLAAATGEVNQEKAIKALADIQGTEQALNKILNGWPSVNEQPVFSFTSNGEELLDHVENSIHFDHLQTTFLMPHQGTMNQVFENLKQLPAQNAESIDLVQQNFNRGLNTLLAIMKNDLRISDAEVVKPIEDEVRSRMPEGWKTAPLQQIALNSIASIPGVTSVMCGLRDVKYMEDITTIFEKGDFPDVAAVIGANQEADAMEAELQQTLAEVHAEVEAEAGH
jgi:aryl-alcohol dehydrogenase-like predicted oxidoreductase